MATADKQFDEDFELAKRSPLLSSNDVHTTTLSSEAAHILHEVYRRDAEEKEKRKEADREARKELYCITDPLTFTSSNHIEDFSHSLRAIKTLVRPNVKLVLPSPLLDELDSLRKERKFASMPEIIQRWIPALDKDQARIFCIGLVNDPKYIDTLQRFFEEWRPIPATEFVSSREAKLEESSVVRSDLQRRLGGAPGELLFQILATAKRKAALIISFAERTFRLAKRFGQRIRRAHSDLKERIKQHAELKGVLRLALVISSLDVGAGLIASMGIHTPLTSLKDLVVGSLLVLDGK